MAAGRGRELGSSAELIAFDRSSVRRIDGDGHLFIEVSPISKASTCARGLQGAAAAGQLAKLTQLRGWRCPCGRSMGAPGVRRWRVSQAWRCSKPASVLDKALWRTRPPAPDAVQPGDG